MQRREREKSKSKKIMNVEKSMSEGVNLIKIMPHTAKILTETE